MSSDSNFHHLPPPRLRPPHQQPRPAGLQRSLYSVPVGGGIPDNQEPHSSSRRVRKSPSDSTITWEPWSTGKKQSDTPKRRKVEREEGGTSHCSTLSAIHQVSTTDKISLWDVARERVDAISEWMHAQPEELLEELKNELQTVHERAFFSVDREEFLLLQKLLQDRTDLNAETLIRAHIAQLQIFVTLNTGIQAFLHPNLTMSHSSLVEILLYKSCGNILCQSPLPANGCDCEICTSRKGFCNQCMCTICGRYDFEVNTCHWIGCESCSHWTHTQCAIHGGQIGLETTINSDSGPAKMAFKCQACQSISELLGWVKDVFCECGPSWNRDTLMRELDFVGRIFHGSEELRGRKLCYKCEDLLDQLAAGIPEATACKLMILFLQELEIEPSKNPETEQGEKPRSPQKAYNAIAEALENFHFSG